MLVERAAGTVLESEWNFVLRGARVPSLSLGEVCAMCCVVLCCVVLCCAVLCCLVLSCVVSCRVVLCGVVWCGVLCCVVCV